MTRGIRVLHVDDEPDFATVGAKRLEQEDTHLTVETATNVEDGLDILDDTHIDCIVSDYEMPSQNGIDFLEIIRERFPDLPFILFTGRGSEEIASDAIRAGATDYLQKHSGDQFELLANRIRNAVTQYRATRAERHLRELAERTDRILYIFTHDWSELLFINHAYETIWGRSIDDLRANPSDFLNGIHPDDREMVQDNMAKMTSGESITIEYRVNAAEDYGRWVRVRGEPIFDDAGTVVRVAGFGTEITDQKQREQEMERVKSHLEAAVEAGAVGTWEWHVPSNTLTVGSEFARKFGVESDVARDGVPLEKFTSSIHDEDRARVEHAIDTAVEECSDYEEEYRVWDANDDLRWVRAQGSVECDANGTPVTFPGALTDITERKQYEEQLERQNKRLDEFASVVSHDLQNPLSVARNGLTLVRDDCTSDHLDTIAQAHARMEALINDLLTLARSGDTVGECEPVELPALLDACQLTVDTKAATLDIQTDLGLQADRSRLEQLLENLIRNAVEHGGPDVTITIDDLEGVDGFYVADDGPGIPENDRATVFDAGYTTSSDGTGFGLTIVREIVQAHDWNIRIVESNAGGARFEIYGINPG